MFSSSDKMKFHLINTGALRGELYLVELGEHKILARVEAEGSWPVARLLTDDEIAALPAPSEDTEALRFDPAELKGEE